jgi:hypothetical protein
LTYKNILYIVAAIEFSYFYKKEHFMKIAISMLMALGLLVAASASADSYQCGNFKITVKDNNVGGYPVVGALPYDMTVEGNGFKVYGFPTTKSDASAYTYSLTAGDTYSLTVTRASGAAIFNGTACQ